MKKKLLTLFLLMSMIAAFAQKNISGIVSDSKTNEPIIGASIIVKNTTTGTVSDIDGKYQLSAPSKAIIVVSFVGYVTQEVNLGDQSSVNLYNIAMQQDDQLLKETVVVGYGTQRKSDLTGAISSVKGKDLQGISSGSVDQLLEGKVSGVQVTPVSGRPGASAIIRVRGVGTLNDASPLFVVDGLLLNDISFLNSNDIESIETLKDASSTAIYGSRGANGVIIITTKKGTSKDHTTFTLSSYYGQQELSKKISLTNASQYATLSNELLAGLTPPQPPVFKDPASLGVGTDWQNIIFQKAPIRNVNLSASGATGKMSYYVSGDYFYQGGIVVGGDYQRLSLRINNEYKFSDAVKLGHNLVFTNTSGMDAADVIYNAYYADPTVAARDTNSTYGNTGNRSSVGNPAAQIDFNKNAVTGYRALGSVYLDVNFLKHLYFKTNFGLDLAYGNKKSFTPVFHVSPQQYNDINFLNLEQSRTSTALWENTLTYDNIFGKHHFNIVAGITAQNYKKEEFGGTRKALPGETPDFWYLDSGDPTTQTGYDKPVDPYTILSYLFRANYTFNNKYLITATFRRDGSSKFGVNNRYGNFPAVGLGWRIKEEDFLKNVNWLDNLKFRASYGVIGNEKIGTNKGKPLVDNNLNPVFGSPSTINIGSTATTLPNPDIKWEQTAQTDIGLEMGFLRNRLTAEIDYYDRITDGILIAVPIPLYVGTASYPTVNAAKVENKGFDLTVGWRDKIGGFGYNISVIGSTVNNKVLSLGNGNTELLYLQNIYTLTRTAVGGAIGDFYGYKTLGVLQNANDVKNYPVVKNEVPGDLRFQDTNNDGVIDAKDRVNLGSPIPKLIYSFNLGANYMGFDVLAFFSGVSGNKILNFKEMLRFNTPNFETSVLNRWTADGTSSYEPRVTNGGTNFSMSDRFLSDGSFLSLRNVQIGYTITALAKAGISSFRVYVAATNLKTWSNYSGYTPQITNSNSGDANNPIATGVDGGVYPIARTYTVGLNVTF